MHCAAPQRIYRWWVRVISVSMVSPFRSSVTATVSPLWQVRRTAISSSVEVMAWPLTDSSQSPASTPADQAGPPGVTSKIATWLFSSSSHSVMTVMPKVGLPL